MRRPLTVGVDRREFTVLPTRSRLLGFATIALFAIQGPLITASAAGPRKIMVAGDIACAPGEEVTKVTCHHKKTANLIVRRDPDWVLTAGDNQYEDGILSAFLESYDPTWGRFKERTRPSPGNHDRGAGYYDYFGAQAGRARRGFYSFDAGAWHLVSLNSNISRTADSRQVEWLRKDLSSHPARCTLAYWHHPRFSSGEHGSDSSVADFWAVLYAAGADVVISGHDHDYERFAPQDPLGNRDRRRGIRQFVVGTGGHSLRPFGPALPLSRVRNADTFGVLKLQLSPNSYEWRFIPERGRTFTDEGNDRCHK
jgi:acid phosphatase type 7